MLSEISLVAIGVIISGIALSGTVYSIYRQYLKGPDIRLIITQDEAPNEFYNFNFGHRKIQPQTQGIGKLFDAVFVNEGSRIGALLPIVGDSLRIKIMPDGVDSNESKYFAPVLSVSFETESMPKFPKELNVGETLPIIFEFHVGGGAENIIRVINEYEFFIVKIEYKVTTRKGIEIKSKEIRINMEGAEV